MSVSTTVEAITPSVMVIPVPAVYVVPPVGQSRVKQALKAEALSKQEISALRPSAVYNSVKFAFSFERVCAPVSV